MGLFVCFLCINVPLKVSFSRSTELNSPLPSQVSLGDHAKEEGQLWEHWARSQVASSPWECDLGQVTSLPSTPCPHSIWEWDSDLASSL